MTCVKPFYHKIPGNNLPVPLPCGQCVVCKINRAREWAFRMVAESTYWPDTAFLTLTYSDDEVLNVNKKDLQDAFKRARFAGLQFKYFASSEYGGVTGRPHYHVCLFYKGDLAFVPDESFGKNNGHLAWWPHGIVNLGTFTRESARYTADYMLKELGAEQPSWRVQSFRLVSLGMGEWYFMHNRFAYENNPLRFGSSFISVPRYFRKRMVQWIDDNGVPLRNLKYVDHLYVKRRISNFRLSVMAQREHNVLAKQRLFSTED